MKAAFRHRQTGAALLLAMLLLLLLSGVVTTAFSDNQWQLRIASHEVAEARAEAAARSALAWAEDWLLSRPGDQRPPPCPAACGAGTLVLAAGQAPADLESRGEAWWLGHAHADGIEPDTGVLLASRDHPGTPLGRWLVEEAHFEPANPAEPGQPDTSYYRIVARAARAPRGEAVVLEAIVARPWGDPAWLDALPGSSPGFCRQADAPVHCGRLAWRRRQ